jgi:hypothetical protein
MLHTMLMSVLCLGLQRGAAPPLAPTYAVADIAQLAQLLKLEGEQTSALRLLLDDHALAWQQSRAQIIADTQGTPAWAQAASAHESWRAASEEARIAQVTFAQATRRSLKGDLDARALTQLRLAKDATARNAATTRKAMFEAREKADPGHAALFAAITEAQAALTLEIDDDIAGLLDAAQIAKWPQARQRVRRTMRLRSLALTGAAIDLRGIVLRRMPVANNALQAELDTWCADTDAVLDNIEALSVEAQLAIDDVLTAAILRDADRLQVVQVDRTLLLAKMLEARYAGLQGLYAMLQTKAFPLTWGSTKLHLLAAAAKQRGDTEVQALANAAVAQYMQSVQVNAETWQAIERAGSVSRLMQMRGLRAEAIDTPALQLASDAQRSLRKTRDAIVQAQLRTLLQSITPQRIDQVLPGMPLPNMY